MRRLDDHEVDQLRLMRMGTGMSASASSSSIRDDIENNSTLSSSRFVGPLRPAYTGDSIFRSSS